MPIVVGDCVWKNIRPVLPGLPPQGAHVAVFTRVTHRTSVAFLARVACFTLVTGWFSANRFGFMAFVTPVTFIAGPSEITRTDPGAVNSRMADSVDAIARGAIQAPLVFRTATITNPVRVLPS